MHKGGKARQQNINLTTIYCLPRMLMDRGRRGRELQAQKEEKEKEKEKKELTWLGHRRE